VIELFTLSAVLLGLLRALGVKSILFQGVAHIFVGFAFGFGTSGKSTAADRGYVFGAAIALTVLELLAFIISKLT
jgi:hypothetical protein